MRKLAISILVAVMLAAMLIGGCAKPAPTSTATPAPSPAPPKTLDISVASPLTGPVAFYGGLLSMVIQLAIDDQNEEGGVTIAGQNYMLNAIVRDTKANIIEGRNIAEEMIFDKGVKVIAGAFLADAIGVQNITEKNQVIGIFQLPVIPAMCAPDKPYSFFAGPPAVQLCTNPCAYVQNFYPEDKTVASMAPDMADTPEFEAAIRTACSLHGLEWIDLEKFPVEITDFMPVISRTLAKKPDIIDTSSTGGVMGPKCVQLVKQLREAGFDGIIMLPCGSPPGLVEEVVPKEYRVKIVTTDVNADGSVVTQRYRDVRARFMEKYQQEFCPVAVMYNGAKAFLEFLDGQDSMDTTAWMEGFARYRWQGLFGFENYWMGKKVYGIDRRIFFYPWTSEWIDGQLKTEWSAPIPYEMYVEE